MKPVSIATAWVGSGSDMTMDTLPKPGNDANFLAAPITPHHASWPFFRLIGMKIWTERHDGQSIQTPPHEKSQDIETSCAGRYGTGVGANHLSIHHVLIVEKS
jgi:hypothetical protein